MGFLVRHRVLCTILTIAQVQGQKPTFWQKIPGLQPTTAYRVTQEVDAHDLVSVQLVFHTQATNIQVQGVPARAGLSVTRTGHHEELATVAPIDIVTQDGLVTITIRDQPGVTLSTCHIQVPAALDVQIIAPAGSITTQGLSAAQSIRQTKGPITIAVPPNAPQVSVYARTQKGTITLQTQAPINAHLYAQVRKGTITSDIPMTIGPLTGILTPAWWKEQQHKIQGTIGKGGVPITLEVDQGKIIITDARN